MVPSLSLRLRSAISASSDGNINAIPKLTAFFFVRVHLVEHGGHFPAESIEVVVDHTVLLRPIAIVIIDLVLGTECEGNVGLVIVAD